MEKLNELVELANKASVAGQGTPEMVDFRVTANPDTIIAIAEAFRELEKEVQKNLEGALAWQQRAEAAEAKLAELEKQKPAGKFTFEPVGGRWHHVKHGEAQDTEPKLPLVKLFTLPAPAINLADFVPKKLTHQMGDYPVNTASINSWNACVDAILRNIEEANK